MSTTPLHRLAESMRPSLLEAARNLPTPCHEAAQVVRQKLRVSVNMKANVLRNFLGGEPRLNAFEHASKLARERREPVDPVLRELLGKWYGSRTEFEARYGGGKHFHYGALNIGTLGAPRTFGEFCVVDRRLPSATKPDPVWIAGDSLHGKRFHGHSGSFDSEAFSEWVAPCDLSPELVAKSLAGRTWTDEELPTMVCSDSEYFEAVGTNAIRVEDVEEIRSDSEADLQRRARAVGTMGAGAGQVGQRCDLRMRDELRRLAEAKLIMWKDV